MALAIALLLAVPIGSCASEPDPTPVLVGPVDAGDEAWVRRAVLYLWGRHARSVNEVAVLVDLVEEDDRSAVANAMARGPEGRERRRQVVLDQIHYPRVSSPGGIPCRGRTTAAASSPALAEFVRDHAPREQPDALALDEPWTIADLVHSALLLEDISPFLRGRLLTHFGKSGNAQTLMEETSSRQESAEMFGANWINRRAECLPCHNSAFSVTGSTDPRADRTWELPGLFERAIFGADDGGDSGASYAMWRRYGVMSGFHHTAEIDFYDPPPDRGCREGPREGCNGCSCEEAVCAGAPECCSDAWTEDCANRCVGEGGCADPVNVQPWGISERKCGGFVNPDALQNDILGGTGFFIEDAGADASVWDIDPHLRTGFDGLRTRGALAVAADATVDGGEAVAYLMGASLADRAWFEAVGASLTLGHGFSRNREQRDILEALSDRFVASGFSTAELWVAVTEHPLFNQAAPADVPADDSPYGLAPVFDPFSPDRESGEAQANSFGDSIHRLDGRVVLTSLYGAMGWPTLTEFHGGFDGADSDQAELQGSIGVFMKDSLPGFRAVATQPLLAWEAAIATCRDVVPARWGCEASDQYGCPDCPCRDDVCSDHPECCVQGEGWSQACAEACSMTDLGCGAPPPSPSDFIDRLVAALPPETSLGDAVATVKDRLLSDPRLTDGNERVALSRLLRSDLDAPIGDDVEEDLRLACAVFAATPQFLFGGDPGEDVIGTAVPVEIEGTAYSDWCEAISADLYAGALTCREDGLDPG